MCAYQPPRAKDKLEETVDKLEVSVPENSNSHEQHAAENHISLSATSILFDKGDGVVQEVENKGHIGMVKFESLKSFIGKKHNPKMKLHSQKNKYADKVETNPTSGQDIRTKISQKK